MRHDVRMLEGCAPDVSLSPPSVGSTRAARPLEVVFTEDFSDQELLFHTLVDEDELED